MTDESAGRRTYRINPHRFTPSSVAPVDSEWCAEYYGMVAAGAAVSRASAVCIVGMARDIAGVLPVNLERVKRIGAMFRKWSAVVVENDSTDGTKDILRAWEESNPGRVVVDSQDYGRERLSGFESLRVQRYAEYRTKYRDIAASSFADSDFVIAVDLDPWGGWSETGVLNGLGWMATLEKAAGIASVSLYEQNAVLTSGERGTMWCHYDHWAYRGAGWRHRWEPHFSLWVPPVGSPPVRCNSAFGALCIYRANPFFSHAPCSIDGDIEHVGLHRAMANAGWEFYLNPSQRTLMSWIPSDEDALPDTA